MKQTLRSWLRTTPGWLLWMGALVGYFGPWVGQRAAALAWNPYDIFDILRVLPAIESGALQVNLQTLHFPLLGWGVLLPLLGAEFRWGWRWLAALVGLFLAVATLPPYPIIMTAAQIPGWDAVLWRGLATMAVIVAMAGFAPRLGRWRPWIGLVLVGAAAIPPLLTFRILLPVIGELYRAPIAPGWGMWLFIVGCLALGVWFLREGINAWRKGTQSQ